MKEKIHLLDKLSLVKIFIFIGIKIIKFKDCVYN